MHHSFAQGDVEAVAVSDALLCREQPKTLRRCDMVAAPSGTSLLSGLEGRSRKFGYLAPISVLSGWSTLGPSTQCERSLQRYPGTGMLGSSAAFLVKNGGVG